MVELEDALIDVYKGNTTRLIVTVPPRHGKSTLISHAFPAWWLGNRPDDRVILCSYAAEFAASWGEKAKNVLLEWGHLFNVEVSDVRAARDDWLIKGHDGGMTTAGVGGPITGKGADLFIIDDPVKNAEEAHSDVYREKTWEWFLSTAYTRLEPNGRLIVIMTRWNEDDLAGRLLADEEDQDEEWRVINFPALAEEDDPLDRPVGDALFPQRFPRERLDLIQQRLGEYWFAALYQQRPAPLAGGMFKREWFRYFEEDPYGKTWVLRKPEGQKAVPKSSCWYLTTVDPAWTEKTTADYTVMQTWAVTPERDMLLVDQLRAQMDGTDVIPAMQNVYARWRPSFLGIEAGGGGQSYLAKQAFQTGLPVTEMKPDKDKVLRSMPLQARMSGGGVYFPLNETWVRGLESEMLVFPNGAHDDQVDAAAYAAGQLIEGGGSPFVVKNFVR